MIDCFAVRASLDNHLTLSRQFRNARVYETASSSLRQALCDPTDQAAWGEFTARYRPIIVAFARRIGASDPDAEDVAQDTLSAFVTGFRRGDYDPAKGRLRAWLLGIARKKLLYLRRRHAGQYQVQGESSGTGFFERIPDATAISQIWEAEWRAHVLRECLRRLRGQFNESTVRAFELMTLHDWSSQKAADELGMSANAICKANRRVVSRLRELQEFIEQEW